VGHFEAAGVDLKRELKEFRVTPDALLPVGTEVSPGSARLLACVLVEDVRGYRSARGHGGEPGLRSVVGLRASGGCAWVSVCPWARR
jgi:large subunit ribosomal protein L3